MDSNAEKRRSFDFATYGRFAQDEELLLLASRFLLLA
jgi:hypothetical protein